MSRSSKLLVAVAAALCSAAPLAHTQSLIPSPNWASAMPSGPDARIKITEQYARMVARDAYFWAWPMVNIYNRRLAFKQAPEVGLMNGVLPFAPLNRFVDVARLHPAGAALGSQPGRGLRWAIAAFDETPVVGQVPDFGDRFWVY